MLSVSVEVNGREVARATAVNTGDMTGNGEHIYRAALEHEDLEKEHITLSHNREAGAVVLARRLLFEVDAPTYEE